MNELFNAQNIIDFLLKNKKHILLVALLALIISTIASFFIETRYKSTVVMIPTTTVSISRTLFKEWDDVLKFGEEKEAEQMLQILNSEAIRTELAQKYNLYKHYNIAETDKYKRLTYKLEFEDRIWFSRTPSNAVEIDVMDRSPDTAAAIANDIAALVDSTKNRLQHERAMKALEIVESEYMKKKQLIHTLEDSLKYYTNDGIFDYEKQCGIIYKQYAKCIAANNNTGAQQLESKLKLVGKKGNDYVALRDYLSFERNQEFGLKAKFDQAKVDAEKTLPSKYLINPGVPAEKKSSPIRWLIVLVSTLSSVLIAIICLVVLERVQSLKLKFTLGK